MHSPRDVPKFVGPPLLTLAPGVTGTALMTAPHNFVGIRLCIVPIDAGLLTMGMVMSIRHNNHEFIAGTQAVTTLMFPEAGCVSVAGTSASVGGNIATFRECFTTGDRFSVTLQNITANNVDFLIYWVTDYGDPTCNCKR